MCLHIGHFSPAQPERQGNALRSAARCLVGARPSGCRNVRHGGASGLLKPVRSSGVLQPEGCAPMGSDFDVAWLCQRARRLLPVTNPLAAGQAFVHVVFAMSDTQAFSEL